MLDRVYDALTPDGVFVVEGYVGPSRFQWTEAQMTMVTLAALCLAHGLDMHAAGDAELERVWLIIDKIRAKRAKKPDFGPLPE